MDIIAEVIRLRGKIMENKLQLIEISFDDESSYITRPEEIGDSISAEIESLLLGLFTTITLSVVEFTEKEFEFFSEFEG